MRAVTYMLLNEMRDADPDAPPIKSIQSYYNWKRKGFDGFTLDTPLADVEIDNEEPKV
jgi:hypothetical protein